MKNYNEGLIKACAILTEAWQDYFDDEVLSKNEFKPVDAFYNSLMDKFNKELMEESVPAETLVMHQTAGSITAMADDNWIVLNVEGDQIRSYPFWDETDYKRHIKNFVSDLQKVLDGGKLSDLK